MSIKIAFANMKGGIGKTTSALAVADCLIEKGYKVLMIDTDSQRNTTRVYDANTENVPTLYDIIFAEYNAAECIQKTAYGDIIPSDSELRNADTQIKPGPKMYKHISKGIKELENEYDFIIFDTPPLAGVLLGNVLMCSDYVICPVTCDMFGVQGIMDFYEIIKEYQEDNENLKILGLLKIKYKGNQILAKELNENILPDYAKQMNTIVFKTAIRESVKCQEAQTLKQPLSKYAEFCNTSFDYKALTDEILELIKEV